MAPGPTTAIDDMTTSYHGARTMTGRTWLAATALFFAWGFVMHGVGLLLRMELVNIRRTREWSNGVCLIIRFIRAKAMPGTTAAQPAIGVHREDPTRPCSQIHLWCTPWR